MSRRKKAIALDVRNENVANSFIASMNMPHIRDPIISGLAKKMKAKAIPTFWIGDKLAGWESVTGKNIKAHTKKHLDPKRVNIFTPASRSSHTYTHYNAVIIDPKKKSIELFDPGLSQGTTIYSRGDKIRKALKEALPKYKQTLVSPRKMPAQGNGDSFCQTHAIKYIEQRAKGKNPNDITAKYDKIPTKNKGELTAKISRYANKKLASNSVLRADVAQDMKNNALTQSRRRRLKF
jgi:hypothetical protein